LPSSSSSDWREEVRALVEKALHPKGKILVLSLTGSRAFGWADDRYDYDVHGGFHVPLRYYWDWVHMGKIKYDVNLWSFEHLLGDVRYQHFNIFENLSNPFYVDPSFDIERFLSFCGIRAAANNLFCVDHQIDWSKRAPTPRTLLHTYRALLVGIYFLENVTLEINVAKLFSIYDLTHFNTLREAHLKGESYEDVEGCLRDFEVLRERYVGLLEEGEKEDDETILGWVEEMRGWLDVPD